MDAIVAAALNEISARGAQGCLLQHLWSGLQSTAASTGLHLCDGVKQAIWQTLLKVPGLGFAPPETWKSSDCLIPNTHLSIQAVEDAESLGVTIVAPEHLRDSCIGLYDLKFSDAGLSTDQRLALERLAKARTQGVTQNQLAKEFCMKGNKMFYIVRSLESRGLLVRQSTLVRTKESGSEAENGFKNNSIVNTNLIHLPRYAKHLNLSSQQRFEIRKSNASGLTEDRNLSSATEDCGEGGREDLLIKDDLPAMKAICDKLEEADGKVLVVSDLKVSLGYRLTAGHRAWRRISKRLLTAGLVEVFRAQIDKKVAPCIRLLKSFDPRAFHLKASNGHDDYEPETVKGTKRGQVTEQLMEIPIDHQIYDMIDSEGSKGLTVTEMWKRLGLNNKRNYYRLTNMVSRFGLHLQAESHKRSMLYRVWTSSNLNSYDNDCPVNKQQDVARDIHGSELALVDDGERFMNGSYNLYPEPCFDSMRTNHNKQQDSPQSGRLKIKLKQKKPELLKGDCNLAKSNRALVCVGTTVKQSDPDGHMHGEAENIFLEDTNAHHLQIKEKVHMPQPINYTHPMLRAGQRYPCLTVTTVSAQREQRILERLQVEKFILRVELYRWLEDLEKGKSTTMDRKTLTRALQRLQNEGHCKSILVSVPVVTNCGRSRTTEVVLHPSVEVRPELLGQIHEKLRNFEMQNRGQGLARSKNDDSVPILTGIKRTSNMEPSDSQTVRAELMRANGFIPAKMVRVKLLHQYLWGYVSRLSDSDAALSSERHGYDPKNPNSTCKLFSLDSAIKAMPLELFLQVIGSVKKIEALAESCRHGVCLCDLPELEYRSLMDSHATGRLSWLIDVIRRLKLLRLVMIKGRGEEDADMVREAVLTYAMEIKPYIEEPAPRAVPSLNVFDFRPRLRHQFEFSNRDIVDSYWKTLEYFFSAADPTIAAHAFPGSSVPEIFVHRSWTSVRVMSIEQRTELLKRIANDDLEKRMSFKECVKISKDLNLTLEQVLRVSYEKNRKARLMSLRREAITPSDSRSGMQTGIKNQRHSPSKRKRSSLEESEECENLEFQHKKPSLHRDIAPYREAAKNEDLSKGSQTDEGHAGHNDCKQAHCKGIHDDGQNQDVLDDEDCNDDVFINHVSARLKPTRRRRFPWTDSLERSLIAIYARYRATMGARFHRVDWVSVPGLPAPPETCRRRIANLKQEPAVRKALMNLCNLLGARYARYLQQREREQTLDDAVLAITEGSSQIYPLWDDFEEPVIASAVDEVIRCKCTARSSSMKRIGGSSSFVAKWSDPVLSEKSNSCDLMDNGFGPGYVNEWPCSPAENAPNVSYSAAVWGVTEIIAPDLGPSTSGIVAPDVPDAHPHARVNIGGGRSRVNRRPLPKKVQKLLQNEDFSTKKLVHKSVAVANAVELIKLVFLNSSANTEVPRVLVETLRRYSEFDVFAAFNFLRAHELVVVGHGAQPFVLSPTFFHNASASPFPIGTGEKACKFTSWLIEVEKQLEEDWISLPAELHCGELFHLFGLVSSGDILIVPSLPDEGIGDADDPRGLKRKIDKEKASRDPQFVKPKLPWPKEGELCTRRERGFPGIQVHVHRAKCPMADIVTANLNDKDQVEDAAVGKCGQSDLDHDLSRLYSCDHLQGPDVPRTGCHELPLKALVTFAEELSASRKMQEEPAFFEPQWFELALDSIEKAGDEGLSLEKVAESIGVDENHLEEADAIVEALQSFDQVIKVSAFDHVRAIAKSHSAKYSLLVSSGNLEDNNTSDAIHENVVRVTEKTTYEDIQKMYRQESEGFCRSSIFPSVTLDRQKDKSMTVGDGHLVTILELPEMDKTDQASCKQVDTHGIVSTGKTAKCHEQLETVTNSPAAQNLEKDAKQNEQNLSPDTQSQFLPILPWLSADGETNTVMLKALTRRVLGIVMQHPGILEGDLIRQLDILNPQTAGKLLQLLMLDDHLHVREMYESIRSPPNILKGLIGAKFEKQKAVWRKHYYANPMSTAML